MSGNTVIASGFVGTDTGPAEVKWASVDITVGLPGDATLIPAVPERRIRVISMFLNASVQASIGFKSLSKTKIQPLVLTSGVIHRFGGDFVGRVVESDLGEPLVINLSVAVTLRGAMNYVEVP